jgi:nitrogen fixation NifU-like protein
VIAADSRPDAELRELYRDFILDHARNPRHFGKLEAATHTAEGINPLCGDKLKLYLALDDEEMIRDASFEGSGCAISMASASMLTETVIGLTVEQADACFATVTGRLTGTRSSDDGPTGLDLDKIRALDGVREFPSRVKCATLAWHAFDSAVHRHAARVTTE